MTEWTNCGGSEWLAEIRSTASAIPAGRSAGADTAASGATGEAGRGVDAPGCVVAVESWRSAGADTAASGVAGEAGRGPGAGTTGCVVAGESGRSAGADTAASGVVGEAGRGPGAGTTGCVVAGESGRSAGADTAASGVAGETGRGATSVSTAFRFPAGFGVTITLLTSLPVRGSARTTLVICCGPSATSAPYKPAATANPRPNPKQKRLKMFCISV